MDRLAVGVALLARAAAVPETLSEGQVLAPTFPPQAQRVQKLYVHACMVMPLMLDRMTRAASLLASHSSPGNLWWLPPLKKLIRRLIAKEGAVSE